MKAYLSYSCKGYQKAPSEFIVNLHKLCFFHLKKHFNDINFITDSFSKNFFKDIPWTSVSTILDDIPDNYLDLWNLSKIYALKYIAEKNEPFIHLDGDVILWKPLPEDIINAEVFAQCPEDTNKHKYELDKFQKFCPNKSIFKKLKFNPIAYNMGIFGGSNLDFINGYAKEILKIVMHKDNQFFWREYDGYSYHWCKPVLVEQYFLYLYSQFRDQKITCLFPEWPSEEEAQNMGYSHLMLTKTSEDLQIKISHLVKDIDLNHI